MANGWKDCVARVYCDGEFVGTAFLVGRGWALTAHHLFFIDKKPRPWENKTFLDHAPALCGRKTPIIEVIGHSEQKDVALLRFDEPRSDTLYIPLDLNGYLYPKKTVDVAGFDSDCDSRRDFTRNLDAVDKLGEWILDVYNSPGTSGSPVVCNGCVVGLLHARNQERNISYVIPLSEFHDFVKRHVPIEIPTSEFKPIELPWYAPYLVNYEKQQDHFRHLIKEHRAEMNESRNRALICLIHGWEGSATASGLAYRLKNDLEAYCLPEFEPYGHKAQFEEPHYFQCGTQAGTVLHTVIESSLHEKLSRKLDKNRPFDSPVLFYTEIESAYLSKAFLQDFLAFWQQGWIEQNHLVLVCLFVHYPRKSFTPFQAWLLTWRAKKLIPDRCLLPPLQPIPAKAIRDWVHTSQASKYLDRRGVQKLLQRLSELFPDGKPLPMETLAPKLDKLLSELVQ